MKPKVCIALCLTTVLLLSGCASYDGKNISPQIDPAHYGSVLPDQAPSAAWPADESAKAAAQSKTTTTIFTVDMQGALDGNRFIGEEFSFYVPPQWRENFVMEAEISGSEKFETRVFNFYYVELETGIQVNLLRIDVIPQSFIEQVGDLGKQELGVSADGAYYYMQSPVTIKPAEEFRSGAAVMDIYKDITSDKLDFQVLV